MYQNYPLALTGHEPLFLGIYKLVLPHWASDDFLSFSLSLVFACRLILPGRNYP